MADITFFDIPTKDQKQVAWTPNPWKARMSLNFKGVPYKTRFIQYPEIAPTLKQLPIAPNEQGPEYTCPAVQFPDGTAVMESLAIAKELDKRYPGPPLHTSSPIVTEVANAYMDTWMALAPELLPQVPVTLLEKSSAEYFDRTRVARFGMPLAQYRAENGGQKAFTNAKPYAEKLANLLKREPSGPFFLGATPSFADFIVASAIEFMSRLNKSNYDQFLAFDPAFGELYKACAKWLERDD